MVLPLIILKPCLSCVLPLLVSEAKLKPSSSIRSLKAQQQHTQSLHVAAELDKTQVQQSLVCMCCPKTIKLQVDGTGTVFLSTLLCVDLPCSSCLASMTDALTKERYQTQKGTTLEGPGRHPHDTPATGTKQGPTLQLRKSLRSTAWSSTASKTSPQLGASGSQGGPMILGAAWSPNALRHHARAAGPSPGFGTWRPLPGGSLRSAASPSSTI